MKSALRIIATTCALLVTVWASVCAQAFPEPMKPARLVNDYAQMLSSGQTDALENKLVTFERETSVQIAIVTLADLDGLDISDYAARLFDRWGIGRGKDDSGILILVKPKTRESLGQVFISTGYGLEGAVPDALAGRIVDYDILPAFREGDYYGGLDQAATTLMGLTRGEFTAQEYLAKHENPAGALFGLVSLLVLFLVIYLLSRRRDKRGYTVSRSGGTYVPPIILGGGNRRSGGGFGGFSGGSGGFGGFGGGRTGGGGAGGSW